MNLEWVAICLGGGSLAVSVAILIIVVRVLRGTSRAERAGVERMEILREQQERLAFVQNEHSLFLEDLERRRRKAMDEMERQKSELASSVEPGHPKARPWLHRMFGR